MGYSISVQSISNESCVTSVTNEVTSENSVPKKTELEVPSNINSFVNTVINGEESGHTVDDAIVTAGIGYCDNFIACKVLMDSGACYNCITPRVLDRLKAAGISFKIEASSRRDPGAAN